MKIKIGKKVINIHGEEHFIDSINGDTVVLRFHGPVGSATIVRDIAFIQQFYKEVSDG